MLSRGIGFALGLLAVGCGGSVTGQPDSDTAGSVAVHDDDTPVDGGDAVAIEDQQPEPPPTPPVVEPPIVDPPGPVVPSGGLATPTNTKRPIGTLYDKKGFWEYLPKNYGGTVPRPLLIFFHGYGENGSGNAADLEKVPAWGPPQLVKQGTWPADRPFVLLSPQQQSDCPSADDVHDFIDFALDHYDVDPTRVYLTGLSCGAIGTASYFAKYGSDTVAAAALIAGDISPAWSAQGCDLVEEMPLWVFHGAADGVVSVNGDRTNTPKLAACSPRKDVQYTEYPGADHAESWIVTYDLSAGHDIFTWFTTFSR